jgi:hypothetical protein
MPGGKMTANKVEVVLEWYELAIAAQVGLSRQMRAMQMKRPDKHGLDPEKGWSVHIEGAAGEMALAKHKRVYWDGSVDVFKSAGDVGDIQVRTRSKSWYELLVRKDDRDEDIFVLVTGLAPNFAIVGWAYGHEAKLIPAKDHGGREPAHFMPQGNLRDIDTLKIDGG